MSQSDNILRSLISSSNDQFKGALEIVDIVTEMIGERLRSPLCATLYRRYDSESYRLLSIEDNIGIETSALPKLERFINANSASDNFTDRYTQLIPDEFIAPETITFATDVKMQMFYGYRFTPAEDDSAIIAIFLDDEENTSVLSAGRVCRLAAQQLSVVFKFVGHELRQRMVTNFFGVLLKLSSLRYEDSEIQDTLNHICALGCELKGVQQIELIGRDGDSQMHREAVRAVQTAVVDADSAETEEADLYDSGLKSAQTTQNGYLVALDRSPEPARFLHFLSSEREGFDSEQLRIIRLFSIYASVTLANHTILLRYRKMNSELRTAQDRLLEAESLAALGDMASGLAHEFNNILGGIIGQTQVVKAIHPLPMEVVEKLDSIESLADEGGDQIRRIQEFAIQARPTNLEPIALADLLDSYTREDRHWTELAKERSVNVVFRGFPSQGTMIKGKADDICLMLDNLIGNAVEVSPPEASVEVNFRIEGDRAVIQISDSGPGVPSSIKNKIFNPFFTTKDRKGAGLGLSVAHGIAVRHGGSISAASKAEAIGATFTTSFPLVDPPTTAAEVKPPEFINQALKIMVVDDDPQIREVLGDMLNLIDQESEVYADGESAIKSFTPGEFDLLITDLGMPGMSGVELMKSIKELDPELPVALLTGWGGQLDLEEMSAKGAHQVLSKPFYLKDIKNLISSVSQRTR